MPVKFHGQRTPFARYGPPEARFPYLKLRSNFNLRFNCTGKPGIEFSFSQFLQVVNDLEPVPVKSPRKRSPLAYFGRTDFRFICFKLTF